MLLTEDSISTELLKNESKESLISYVESKYKGWIYQIKQNGIRAVISVKNGKITAIRDRRDTPVLQNFPELLNEKFPVNEGLFDCEIVMKGKNGKSHYYNEYDDNRNITQAGIQLRSMSVKGKEIIEKYPVNVVIFDILKLDSKVMITEPYRNRASILEGIGRGLESDRIEIAEIYNDFGSLWERVVNEDLEGVVIKNPDAMYEIDTRSKENVKLKNYKIVDIEVTDTEKNNKGVRVTGKDIDGLEVNFQVFGVDDIPIGTNMKMKYLEKIKNGNKHRYSQTTRA